MIPTSPSLSSANQPPTFQQLEDKLKTFAGENFVFQFMASDPEGSALLFQLDGGPEGALLSPAGLLIWRVPEEEEEEHCPVHITLLDECNAQSSFTVEVTEEEGKKEEEEFIQEAPPISSRSLPDHSICRCFPASV